MGLTYGVYMNVSGFSFWYPALMSLTIFAGSMEFITVHLLLGAFHPLQAGPIQKHRMKKYYLIFGMCDESFSINYTAAPPPEDRGWFMFWVTLLNHFYWFSGSALGGHSVLLSN